MDMHRDDGIYTATCRYFRDVGPIGPLRGSSTTQHTSQAAAFEALNQALHAARADRASQIDVSLTRDDTAETQVIFAAGPRHIDDVHPEIDEHRSPYSRAWEVLTTHANEILPELRDPHSPVHQPLSPELHDVAWAARNVHDANHWTIDKLQAHLDGELDRAMDRARDAGHSEAQIDSAARTDPDLDMRALRQHSATMLETVRNFSADPALTPAQAGALSAAADRQKMPSPNSRHTAASHQPLLPSTAPPTLSGTSPLPSDSLPTTSRTRPDPCSSHRAKPHRPTTPNRPG